MVELRVPEYVTFYPDGDMVVVMDLRNRKRHGLTGLTATLWKRMAPRRMVHDLTEAVLQDGGRGRDEAAAAVDRFAADLGARGLIYVVPE